MKGSALALTDEMSRHLEVYIRNKLFPTIQVFGRLGGKINRRDKKKEKKAEINSKQCSYMKTLDIRGA